MGAYVLTLAGLGSATPVLTTLGLLEDGQVTAVPPASVLVQQLARRSGIAPLAQIVVRTALSR